ncbi:MAG TPA: hypothetical protein VK763_05345 [Terriglobales bacterium]|nr:hypothetical protein [Terriglobales bacterium]
MHAHAFAVANAQLVADIEASPQVESAGTPKCLIVNQEESYFLHWPYQPW